MTAEEAAAAIARGVRSALPSVEPLSCPMADGGEGTIDAFLAHGATRRVASVTGPRGGSVDAVYATEGATAIVEMASASGLGLISAEQRDPTKTTTYGTGELIAAALDNGAHRLIAGIGGSATNDAGVGMLRALGVRFLDGDGTELGNGILDYDRLASIDIRGLDSRVARTHVEVAVDVDNPLCGPSGASRTFAAQKGATPEQIELLDRVLAHVAEVSAATLGTDFSTKPGAGAAGGLGFALMAFLRARLERGVELVAREVGLGDLLEGASLCITGEGKIDDQTLHGKTVAGVAKIARRHHVAVVAFGGVVERDAAAQLRERGVTALAIAPAGTPPQESMKRAAEFLESAVANFIRDRAPGD